MTRVRALLRSSDSGHATPTDSVTSLPASRRFFGLKSHNHPDFRDPNTRTTRFLGPKSHNRLLHDTVQALRWVITSEILRTLVWPWDRGMAHVLCTIFSHQT